MSACVGAHIFARRRPGKRLFAIMSKTRIRALRSSARRHWLSYICETSVQQGELPTWEVLAYFYDHLFGPRPNPRILHAPSPYEASLTLLRRIYRPLIEATGRDLGFAKKMHVFLDVSLTGHSAVLVVCFHKRTGEPQLLHLETVKTWDLVFDDATDFNRWAERQHHRIAAAMSRFNQMVALQQPASPVPLRA